MALHRYFLKITHAAPNVVRTIRQGYKRDARTALSLYDRTAYAAEERKPYYKKVREKSPGNENRPNQNHSANPGTFVARTVTIFIIRPHRA